MARADINEILDYFSRAEINPGSDWAFDEDQSSLGVDFRSSDGTKFWLDINRDGTLSIFWKPADRPSGETLTFVRRG